MIFIRKFIFTRPKAYKKLVLGIRVFTLVFLLFCIIIVFHDNNAEEGTYLWLSALCCVVYFVIYRILTRRSRQYRKENRISLNDLVGDTGGVAVDIEKTEMKRYEKLNKKRGRKGENELSFEEFLEKEKKECTSWDKKPSFYIFLTAASTVLGVIFTYLVSGFEGIADLFVFIGVMIAAEGVLMYGLFKLTDIGTKARLNWINSKRDKADINTQENECF